MNTLFSKLAQTNKTIEANNNNNYAEYAERNLAIITAKIYHGAISYDLQMCHNANINFMRYMFFNADKLEEAQLAEHAEELEEAIAKAKEAQNAKEAKALEAELAEVKKNAEYAKSAEALQKQKAYIEDMQKRSKEYAEASAEERKSKSGGRSYIVNKAKMAQVFAIEEADAKALEEEAKIIIVHSAIEKAEAKLAQIKAKEAEAEAKEAEAK